MNTGRKQINQDELLQFVQENSSATHEVIAQHFSVSRWTVGETLRANGIKGIRRGAAPKRQRGQSDEEYAWELRLHDFGLGMNRGSNLGGLRIYYGQEPKHEAVSDVSATRDPDNL
jgi:hypothetical protein